MNTMTQPTICPVCRGVGDTLTTYRVERIGAEVDHWTCSRDTERLKVDMIEAGWTAAQ